MNVEQELDALGKTAPRIRPADVQAAIASAWYFTAAHGLLGAAIEAKRSDDFNDGPIPESMPLLTFCVITLKNGFTVTGESACAHPETFDAATGRKLAREAAERKIWPLLGYELRTKLSQGEASGGYNPLAREPDFRDRVRTERRELEAKLDALAEFTASSTFEALPEAERDRLLAQSGVMIQYSDILKARIDAF